MSLDAGATIVGTLNMDDHAGGATGVMSAFGPSRNPIDPTRTAGGSSAGAGSAVRSGAVDLALGVDQGGSGRIPAAFCGVVGIKATHGLVPSFGVGHIDHTIDFVTPIARRVGDAAHLLEAIAGDDWRDPQWVRGPITVGDYASAAGLGVEGMRIGVIEESVTSVDCDASVLDGLDRSVSALRDAGATVERFSLPIWADGFATFQPFVAHLIANTIRSEGVGYGHLGYIDVDRLHAFAVARRTGSRSLNPYIKCWMLADRFLHERYLNVSFGVLQNQRLLIRRRISEALTDWDLLLTPTVPEVAPTLLDDEPVDRRVARALSGYRCVQHGTAESERASRAVDPDRVGAGRGAPDSRSGHRSPLRRARGIPGGIRARGGARTIRVGFRHSSIGAGGPDSAQHQIVRRLPWTMQLISTVLRTS